MTADPCMNGIPTVKTGPLSVSKVVLGSNMFSGYSHRGVAGDIEMKKYYTVARIKETLRRAEALGINTLMGRADQHFLRTLLEYREEGGKIQMIAQTCSEMNSIELSVTMAIDGGSHGVYIHGGMVDWSHYGKDLDKIVRGVEQIRKAGLVAAIATHRPACLAWAEQIRLDVDFYMCGYYDPTPRIGNPRHDPRANECFDPEDRDAMVEAIRGLSKPAYHFKVLAGGRTDPAEGFAFAAKHLRPQDTVVIGIYTKDKPTMMEEDIHLLRSCGAF
jgi:hypothetical protein